ncbi:MAG TPA: ATP-binding protein [Stellaceae bacterium]|nr:ATP-binding protein [Stellaceae bacterium]
MIAEELDLIDVLETSPIGAVILGDRDHVLFWNGSLLEILGGLQGDDFADAAAHAFFADPRAYDRARRTLAETGDLRNYETMLSRADGQEAWSSVTMRRITFEGQPAILVWYYDITQSRQRERALELSQETLLDVLDAAPVGAALSDGPGRVSYWNNALMDLIGTGDDLDHSLLIRSAITAANFAIDQEGQGRPFEMELATGDTKWVTAWRRQVQFEGRPAILIWLHDVTDLRTAEMEAERATRTKSSFLATMSHEIRTPMNGVRTLTELLSDTALSPDQAKMVATIQDSADALITVINDILDFSKIEARRLEIDQHPFNFERVLEGVITLLRPKAEEKGLVLGLKAEVGVATWRFGDPMRLRQILLNLIGNAIKFTETGGVTLHVVADGPRLRFNVIDTGLGIQLNKAAGLFTPFAQADASTARRFGGTGLGLSICKALTELMDGEIGVESIYGEGSTFWFALPLPVTTMPAQIQEENAKPSARATRWTPPEMAEAARNCAIVLCADDNPTNRDVLARVLDRLGIAFELVNDGVQAMQRLDRSRHGLLLTDGHMPNMDGWELSRFIRNQEQESGLARLPVVALTADAVRGVEELCREAGMDDYLTKPLSITQVEDTLLDMLPVLAELRQAVDTRAEAGAGSVFGIESNVLELSVLTDLIGTDFGTLETMLEGFVDSAANLVDAIAAAQAVQDPKGLVRAAHSLKGAAHYVGARKLADMAAIVEQAAIEGKLEEARRWNPALRPLLDEVRGAIEKLRVEEKLRQIRREIGELAVNGDGLGAGLDLETVVGITETAADRILAAAETILERVENVQSPDEVIAVKAAVMAIFEACSFQDLTSQRVRKAIARLSEIEERLDAFVHDHDEQERASEEEPVVATQDDIDRLFA